MSTIDEALKAFETAVAEVGVRNVLLVDQLRGAMARALAAQLPAEQSASAVQPLAEAAHWLHSTEHHIALREAHEIAAERDYFDARPNRDGQDQRAMFDAGFRRGFDAAAKLAAEAAPIAQPATAPVVPAGHVVVPSPITEGMHVAACKVLTRAQGLDGTPQRMLDAMLDAAPAAPAVQPGWLTDDWLQRHALLAADCPPDSAVVLLPSIKRMLAATPAVPQAAPVVPQPAAQQGEADRDAEAELICAEDVLDGYAAGLDMEQTHFECVGDYIKAVVDATAAKAVAQQGEAVAVVGTSAPGTFVGGIVGGSVVPWSEASAAPTVALLKPLPAGTQLYTAPPARQAVALTGARIAELWVENGSDAEDAEGFASAVMAEFCKVNGIMTAGGEVKAS